MTDIHSDMLMSYSDNWNNEELLIGFLSQQLRQGKLAILLGAGVSADLGLPKWQELIDLLIAEHAGANNLLNNEGDNKSKIEYLKTNIFRNKNERYLEAVRKSLWKNIKSLSRSRLRKNATLAAISSLTMASSPKKPSFIITLNYDNLVELYLKYHGLSVLSVYDEDARHWWPASGTIIYHPHGFLPFPGTDKTSKSITLDQLSFSNSIGDKTLPWYRLLLTLLCTHFWLFVGVSGDDPSLDTMLIEANKRHVIRLENTLYWGVRFSAQQDAVKDNSWKNRGIFTWHIKNYKKDLSDFLFKICCESILS